jgi:hypothetical protein
MPDITDARQMDTAPDIAPPAADVADVSTAPVSDLNWISGFVERAGEAAAIDQLRPGLRKNVVAVIGHIWATSTYLHLGELWSELSYAEFGRRMGTAKKDDIRTGTKGATDTELVIRERHPEHKQRWLWRINPEKARFEYDKIKSRDDQSFELNPSLAFTSEDPVAIGRGGRLAQLELQFRDVILSQRELRDDFDRTRQRVDRLEENDQKYERELAALYARLAQLEQGRTQPVPDRSGTGSNRSETGLKPDTIGLSTKDYSGIPPNTNHSPIPNSYRGGQTGQNRSHSGTGSQSARSGFTIPDWNFLKNPSDLFSWFQWAVDAGKCGAEEKLRVFSLAEYFFRKLEEPRPYRGPLEVGAFTAAVERKSWWGRPKDEDRAKEKLLSIDEYYQ